MLELDDNPNTLLERNAAGFNVRLSHLPAIDLWAVNCTLDTEAVAVTFEDAQKALDAYRHPAIYLTQEQLNRLGLR